MITALLAVVTVGFLAGLVVDPPDAGAAAAGLVPRLAGTDSALLAVGMLGATVMPHAVYLHSALVRDRHGRADAASARPVLGAIKARRRRWPWSSPAASTSACCCCRGSTLFGLQLDGLTEVHAAIGADLGPVVAVLFALALLASGLASTSVGGYAGAVIMDGLLHRRIPLLWRRLVTADPRPGAARRRAPTRPGC